MEHLLGIDVVTLIKSFGLIGILLIIFAESGLFFGFFLPGDSVLFTAGFLASQGYLSLAGLVIGTMVAAILGDTVGYWFGKKIGIKIFNKEKSLFFNKAYPERARLFYEKHGGKAIILARFVPAVRTFVPIMAGVGTMTYRTFLTFNIIGGILWAGGLSLLGYFLGNIIPNVDKYIIPIVLLIIFISILPVVFEFYKSRKTNSSKNSTAI